MKNKLLNELSWRGLLKDTANEENLEEIISSNSSFYVGIDPTSDSLHIGHYMVISLAKKLSEYGLIPIFVIGGFTGSIGDPSGKNSERDLVSEDVIKNNANSIKEQIQDLAKKIDIKEFKVWNNKDLYDEMSITELFQKYGKHFNVNNMLNKEIIRGRLETGISFTEFAYQMFQAIDFLYLFNEHNVKLQIAGSDQWGNITSGLDLIRKVNGSDTKVSGITVNLITDKNGNKIGKSEGKPIWLDNKKLSEYSFYQYIFNQSDEMSEKLLKAMTSISEEELNALVEAHSSNPSSRIIQKELANRLMTMIYDKESYEKAHNTSKIIFEESYSDLSDSEAKDVFGELPIITYSENLIESAIKSNAIASKREYRDLLEVKAVKVNGVAVEEDKVLTSEDYINNKFVIINLGKKKKFIIWN